MSGAEAARRILDSNGLYNVPIEQTPGHLSDHYDPSQKVVRLSPEVVSGYTMSAVELPLTKLATQSGCKTVCTTRDSKSRSACSKFWKRIVVHTFAWRIRLSLRWVYRNWVPT